MSAKKEVLSTEVLTESLDDALSELRKGLGLDDYTEPVQKSKSSEMKGEAEDADAEDDDDDDDEEEGYKETAKSLEASLSEDPEAEAAMDVEPFLRTLVKSFDSKLDAMQKLFDTKVNDILKLQKSFGGLMVVQAELQKSIKETTQRIGATPIPSNSVKGISTDRFAKSKDSSGSEINLADVDTSVLIKSGKLDLVTATVVDNRISKGTLFKSGDQVDMLVKSLMQEVK